MASPASPRAAATRPALASSSSHNALANARSGSSRGDGTVGERKALRPAKSNPNLRAKARTRTLAGEAAQVELPTLPPQVVFEKEIFISSHRSQFPNLHPERRRSTTAPVDCSTPTHSIRAHGPLAQQPFGRDLVRSRPPSSGSTSTASHGPRTRTGHVRQLSLASLHPLEPQSGPSRTSPEEAVRSFAETEFDEGEKRDSDDMSSECDLTFSFDPPRPMLASPVPSGFCSPRGPQGHKRGPSISYRHPSPPPSDSPSRTRNHTSDGVVPPSRASGVVPLSPSAPAPSTSPLPSHPAFTQGHQRKRSSVSYLLNCPPPLHAPTFEAARLPRPCIPPSASASSVSTVGSAVRAAAWTMPLQEMEQSLFWKPDEIIKEDEEAEGSPAEEIEAVPREADWVLEGAPNRQRSLRKSRSESLGMHDRFHAENLSPPPTPNTPNSAFGFVHNPTPPSYPIYERPTTPRWLSWFGTAGRRSSKPSDEMEGVERGEGSLQSPRSPMSSDGGFETYRVPHRPGFASPGLSSLRSPALSLPCSDSNSSFSNSDAEHHWSSPAMPSSFSESSGSPRLPLSTDFDAFPRRQSDSGPLSPLPIAHTVRRPLASGSALPQEPSASRGHRGLKPLTLTLPPKPNKAPSRLATTSLAPIKGSPSKRTLEEGLGLSLSESDDGDARSASPLEPLRLRNLAGAHSIIPLVSVQPSTPQKAGILPRIPRPVLIGTNDLIPDQRQDQAQRQQQQQQHARTYSSAHSTSHLSLASSSSYTAASSLARATHLRSRNFSIPHQQQPELGTSSSATLIAQRQKYADREHTTPRAMSKEHVYSTLSKAISFPFKLFDNLLPAQLVFLLGFVLGPWCWVIGGWGLSPDGYYTMMSPRAPARRPSSNGASSSSPRPSFRGAASSNPTSPWEGGGRTALMNREREWTERRKGEKRRPWILPALRSDSPDKWVWRNRLAAILSGWVVIPGAILAVIFATR